MDTTRWETIQGLFQEARPLPESRRGPFLERACGDDEELRRTVAEMLEASDTPRLSIEEKLLGVSAPASPAEPGKGQHAHPSEVGPYRVIEHIGRGGMADVYLGRHSEFPESAVALKVLRTARGGTWMARRFLLEREILGRLDHPRIATILHGGSTVDDKPYFAMQYIDGLPLMEYVAELRAPISARLRLFTQICEAVDFAHGKGVLHRDLKPSNVLVDDHGDAVLLDFGIGKLLEPLQTGALAGLVTPEGVRLLTPAHAAPEQVTGGPPTVRTDVYGLGLILYELVAGRPAFDPRGMNWLEWERLVVDVDPPPPSRSEAVTEGGESLNLERLDAVVASAIHKEPEARYATVADLAEAVGALGIRAA